MIFLFLLPHISDPLDRISSRLRIYVVAASENGAGLRTGVYTQLILLSGTYPSTVRKVYLSSGPEEV
jgi:hypothetical protein